MSHHNHRRQFLKTTATAGGIAGLSNLGFLSRLAPVSADEAKLDPKKVRYSDDIEPLVRLLGRDAARARVGRSRRSDQEGASLQAASRGVVAGRRARYSAAAGGIQVSRGAGRELGESGEPRFARRASLAADLLGDRRLQISQAQNVKEGNWAMGPVDERSVPAADKAAAAFATAMDNWDESAADAAVAGLARSAKPQEVFEIFCRYGMRDFRDIGHKAIYVANSWRTLRHIGWQHSEPVLRSLAYCTVGTRRRQPGQARCAAGSALEA